MKRFLHIVNDGTAWVRGQEGSKANPMEERLSLLSTTERAAESSDRNPESSASRAASCSDSCAFCVLSEAHGSGARLPAAICQVNVQEYRERAQ